MANVRFVDLTADNLPEWGVFCIRDRQHPGYQAKAAWLKKRFAEGLTFKLLVPEGSDKPVGFIEYTAGEQTWRAIDAPGYLVIHCMMVYPGIYHRRGFGSLLLAECIRDARSRKLNGIATLASKGPWLPDRRIFEQNGFKLVQTSGRYELWVYTLRRGPLPKIRDWEKQLSLTQGRDWKLACAHQCPWHTKAMQDLTATAAEFGYKLRVEELKSAQAARETPSGFGVFALTHNGKLEADHYISATRFRNILQKKSG